MKYQYIVERLSTKLKEYQMMVHAPDSEFQTLMNLDYNSDPNTISSDPTHHITGMLSSHMLGPLFLEYEGALR